MIDRASLDKEGWCRWTWVETMWTSFLSFLVQEHFLCWPSGATWGLVKEDLIVLSFPIIRPSSIRSPVWTRLEKKHWPDQLAYRNRWAASFPWIWSHFLFSERGLHFGCDWLHLWVCTLKLSLSISHSLKLLLITGDFCVKFVVLYTLTSQVL